MLGAQFEQTDGLVEGSAALAVDPAEELGLFYLALLEALKIGLKACPLVLAERGRGQGTVQVRERPKSGDIGAELSE